MEIGRYGDDHQLALGEAQPGRPSASLVSAHGVRGALRFSREGAILLGVASYDTNQEPLGRGDQRIATTHKAP
jgi:hypothetical protein